LSTLVQKEYSNRIENLLQVGKDITELDLDLRKLHEEWNGVLSGNPTELWEPSINAFHSSRFLIQTDVSKIAWITTSCAHASGDVVSANPNNFASGMILLSQVSYDGSTIGSIRLIPSP
jgi:hypothetical protein